MRLPISVRADRSRVINLRVLSMFHSIVFKWILKYGVNATDFLTLDEAPLS